MRKVNKMPLMAFNEIKHKLGFLLHITNLLDDETGNHINRTGEYAGLITNSLLDWPQPGYTLTEFEADDIVGAAKLHDLGKITLPDHLLYKPGKLTDEEFALIKQHSIRGANLLNTTLSQLTNYSFLKTACEVALYHHEKWNGQGYPENLKGESIPLSARIVAIADVYDALTHARSYRKALSHSQAMEIIEKESGSHFDPHLVEVFLNRQPEFENIDLCAVNN